MRARISMLVTCVVALLCGGCSKAPVETGSLPETLSASSATAMASSQRAQFCSLYATEVAQSVVRSRGAQRVDAVTADLAEQPPVTQSDLEAVAPPEALLWLQSVGPTDSTNGRGSRYGDADADFLNLVSLNDWSIAHCDAKYRSVFSEYRGIIN